MRGPPAPPKAGHVVEVWWWNHWILGVWDGKQWKTTGGSPLGVDLYWANSPGNKPHYHRENFA